MNFGEYLVSSVCAKFRSNRKEIQILHDFRAATAQPAESSASDGRPKLEARLAKIAMYAYGTWCMQNPSWVQCPPSSHPNYTSGGGVPKRGYGVKEIPIYYLLPFLKIFQ